MCVILVDCNHWGYTTGYTGYVPAVIGLIELSIAAAIRRAYEKGQTCTIQGLEGVLYIVNLYRLTQAIGTDD